MACNQHFQFPDISFAYCYAFLFLLFHKIYNLCYPQLVGAIEFNSGRHQSKNIYEIIKNFSGWNRSVFDLLHFRDWFQIKMNLNRSQLSCLWKQKTPGSSHGEGQHTVSGSSLGMASTNLRASWEPHCFSRISAAFRRVLRSAYSGGALGGAGFPCG